MKKFMIRIAAVLAAGTMAASAVSSVAMAAETEALTKFLLGDVTMNGKIDLDDVLVAMEHYDFSELLHIDPSSAEAKGIIFTEMKNIIGDICGNDDRFGVIPYPGYTDDRGVYVDTRVSLYDVLWILNYYAQKELLDDPEYTWADVAKLTDEDGNLNLDRMMSVDRGDYELRWDDDFGDYVVALK